VEQTDRLIGEKPNMKSITLLGKFGLGKIAEGKKSREVTKIFDGFRRQIISVELRNGEVLSKHKATEPITVFCIAGNGRFSAGKDLEESQELQTGTFITLEAGIEHEVIATPDLHVLVTKFKEE
jgi:quercetin dioxygenase-like cupin family protein